MREYKSYFHLGQSYGLSGRAYYRDCRYIKDTLIKSKIFSLAGRKALLRSNAKFEIILIDATETLIERQKKSLQKSRYYPLNVNRKSTDLSYVRGLLSKNLFEQGCCPFADIVYRVALFRFTVIVLFILHQRSPREGICCRLWRSPFA